MPELHDVARAASQTGGSKPMPTPGGVPVLIRSPGSSTMNWLRWCTMT